MKNIVNPEVGWKGEPEGDGIDALDDTEWSQLLVIKFRTWTSSRDVTKFPPMVQTKLGPDRREGCPQGRLVEDHLHNVEVVAE